MMSAAPWGLAPPERISGHSSSIISFTYPSMSRRTAERARELSPTASCHTTANSVTIVPLM